MPSKYSIGSLVRDNQAIYEVVEVIEKDLVTNYKLRTLAFLSNEYQTSVIVNQTVGYRGRELLDPLLKAEKELTTFVYSKPKYTFNEWVKFGDGVRVNAGIVRFIKFENSNFWYALIDATDPERVSMNLEWGYMMQGHDHMYGGLADERYISK